MDWLTDHATRWLANDLIPLVILGIFLLILCVLGSMPYIRGC